MVRMTVLASGSRGNCTVVTGGRTSVLVDAGVSCREIVKRMAQAGEDPRKLDAILVTHEHQDHVQGLSVLARRLGIPVYFTEATHRAWVRWMTPQRRITYADWLAARKAEAAAKATIPAWSVSPGDNQSVTTRVAEAGTTAGYRQAELQECAEEASAYEQELLAARGGEANSLSGRSGEREAANNTGSVPAASVAGEDELCAEECFDDGRANAGETGRGNPVLNAPDAPDPAVLPAVEYFRAGKPFSIGDLNVTALTIPHDAADPVGFVLESEGVKIGVATDLGYMPANVSQGLRGCDVVMLESNHDLDMLRDGPYPWSVKQRVLSRVGHLSNTAAAEFLERGYDGQAAYVVLAHLSESNNLPELARMSAEWALRDRMKLLANRLVIAAQHDPTESICL